MPRRRTPRRRVEDRHAKVHHDRTGVRVEHLATVIAGGLREQFRCVCTPEEGHDHEAAISEYQDRLELREKEVGKYRALEGRTVKGAKIVDCQIKVLGPAAFQLYVAWEQEGVRQDWASEVRVEPEGFLSVDGVLEVVGVDAVEVGRRLGQARRRAAAYVAGPKR